MNVALTRGKLVALVIVASVLLAVLAYVVTARATSRPDVGLPDLVASGPAAPGAGTGEEWTGTDVDLGVQEGTQDNVQRMWRRPGGSNIRQSVFRYGDPLVAARVPYYFGSPRFNDKYQKLHWANDAYRSPSADRSQLACGWGTVDNCDHWDYWAQYGQYLVRIEYIGAGERLDVEGFLRYLAPIDEQIGERLSR